MNHNKLESFLKAVFHLATEKCGAEFEVVITEQRETREKFLKSLWADNAPKKGTDLDLVFREIDFDTIVNMSVDYLEAKDFAKFLVDLGHIGLRYGQLDKSREVLKRIVKDYSTVVSQQFLGTVHQMLGDTALYQSDFGTAQDYYKLAQDIHLADENQSHYAAALNAEGITHAEQGNTQSAQTCFKDAHSIAQSVQDDGLIIKTSINLANLSHLLGNYQESIMHLHATHTLIDEADTDTRARVTHNLGIAYKALHNTEKSLKYFDQSISMAETSEDYYLRTLSFLEMSEVLTLNGDIKEGTALVTSAFQAFSEFGDRLGMADAYKVFGTISHKRNADKLAVAFFNNSLSISNDLDNLLGVGETYTALGNFHLSQDNTELARESYQSAKQSFERMKAPARVSEMNTLLKNIE